MQYLYEATIIIVKRLTAYCQYYRWSTIPTKVQKSPSSIADYFWFFKLFWLTVAMSPIQIFLWSAEYGRKYKKRCVQLCLRSFTKITLSALTCLCTEHSRIQCNINSGSLPEDTIFLSQVYPDMQTSSVPSNIHFSKQPPMLPFNLDNVTSVYPTESYRYTIQLSR